MTTPAASQTGGGQAQQEPSPSFNPFMLPTLPEAIKEFKERTLPWTSTYSFWKEKLVDLEKVSQTKIDSFKNGATYANSRWREPNSYIPKFYPTLEDWTYIPEGDLLETLNTALTLYEVKGHNMADQEESRFFIDQDNHELFQTCITKRLSLSLDSHHACCMPQWGIPAHLGRDGMNTFQANAASALYRAEAEAFIKEISTRYAPDQANQLFLNNPEQASKLVQTLWKPAPPVRRNPSLPSTSQKPKALDPKALERELDANPEEADVFFEMLSKFPAKYHR